MNKIRVAIYARVSTAEQAEEGYSIDAQIELIKNRCELEGKTIADIYADRGISGKSMIKRYELQRMLQDSKNNLFDEVIVWKTNRLARNMLDLLQVVKVLEENNVTFKSMTEPYDTSTSSGKLMMNVLGSISEFERTTILDNLKMGMNARAKKGYKNGGKLLGYRSVGVGKDSKLEIVWEEAEIVRKIFNLYVEGKGYKAIANQLNKQGYKTVKENMFSITSISGIISNPTYVGKVRFNRMQDWSNKRRGGKNEDYILVDGIHEAIIAEEIWNKAQEIRAVRTEKYPRTYSGEFPLTGLLKCPVCGYGMVAARTTNTLKDGTKRRFRYYSCGLFKNKGSSACSANSVRAEEAEEHVFNRIKEVILNERVLKDIVKNLNTTRVEVIKPLEEEKKFVDRQIESHISKRNKLFDLYAEEHMPKEMLTEKLDEIETTLEQLNERKLDIMDKIKMNSSDEIPYELVKETMEDFNKLLSSADKDQRKMFLQLIVNKITVGENRKIDTIEIHFNETLKNLIKSFLGEESSDDEDSSLSFVFAIAI